MRKNLLRTAFLLAVFGVSSILVSCGSGSGDKTSGNDSIQDQQKKEDIIEDVKKVMYSLPSPVETSLLLKKAGASYNEALLNPAENASKYESDKKKALNLGVYGADLSYASIFKQEQTIMIYMNISKKLAIGLDLLAAIDQSIIDRLEANHDDRDSVIRIISETFMNSNSTLKDDERPETAALILAGGWIEGLYLATSLTETIEQKELITRIVEQKYSFKELLSLLEMYSDKPDIASVLSSLEPLKAALEVITITTEKPEVVKQNGSENAYEFKSEQKINITQEQYDALKVAVLELRNSIIQ